MTPPASLLVVGLALGISAAAIQTASPPPAASPTQAAVLVLEGSSRRLAVADLQSGSVRLVVTDDVVVHEPSWSPSGALLSYRVEDRIMVHIEGDATDHRILQIPDFSPRNRYSYSPDEQWMVAALRDALALLPVQGGIPDAGRAKRISLAAGCGAPDLRWAPDGRSVLALCPSGERGPHLARVPIDGSPVSVQRAAHVTRILGWLPDGALVVTSSHIGGEKAVVLTPSGTLGRLYPPQENEFVVGFLPGPGLIALAASSEDPGDRPSFRLAGPGANPSHPWLRELGAVRDLSFTPDGWWALFVKRSGDSLGGDVYRVATGMDDARKVLSATAETAYAAPMARPRIAR